MWKSTSTFLISLALLMSLVYQPVLADQTDEARAVAIDILKKIETKNNSELWQNHVSDWFKKKITRDAFLANMTITQSQLGGIGAGRTLIQQNTADGDSQTGYTGKVYTFLFATTYPLAKVYEMIVLIRENTDYRMSGIYYTPNPN